MILAFPTMRCAVNGQDFCRTGRLASVFTSASRFSVKQPHGGAAFRSPRVASSPTLTLCPEQC